ncbi:shikimate dehydrogenase [Betaproteobacteria bacterium GR16-43]|nr:shikimate dehydrogenase [Betaproteobacteria bacterium GR16-43]
MAAPHFVVVGNPVGHSLSPVIHAHFAREAGIALEYTTLLAPLEAFERVTRGFFAAGGRGANITLPFKVEALALANLASARARLAGAANVLTAKGAILEADNTDGAGLVSDLRRNLGIALSGARIAMIGAGGAARGAIAPLLACNPSVLVVVNRTPDRARTLANRFASLGNIEGRALDALAQDRFDVIVNATSTSTKGTPLELPAECLAPGALAYDMAYGPAARAFVDKAKAQGARASDGLGMLVEQAAEAFWLWHGIRPATQSILALLREGA